MKTAELTGRLLGYWVARALDYKITREDLGEGRKGEVIVWVDGDPCTLDEQWGFRPYSDWAVGGPIIEREKIGIIPGKGGKWKANHNHWYSDMPATSGWCDCPLIAAMRSFVIAKFGDEVPDEIAP